MRPDLRVAAYAVCVRGDDVLLARWTGPRGPEWTPPGGGIDHGEDPRDAAVREVEEETGYNARLDALLTVDSIHVVEGTADHHGIRIVYAATGTGGDLRSRWTAAPTWPRGCRSRTCPA